MAEQATKRTQRGPGSRSTAAAGDPSGPTSADFTSQGPQHDLLEEPLLTLVDGPERLKMSLPGVLAALGARRGDGFALIQAHQRHAMHAFLVQLAAMAMHRGRESSAALEPGRWRELLLGLTGGEREPWCLVVPDLAKPAFMQPPVPEGTLDGFREVDRPDLLDVPILAKNHDVKSGRMWTPEQEHWVFALVSAQTMHGYTGRANYGVARMNGGYGSRPGVGLAPSLRAGDRFVRDLWRLPGERASLLKRFDAYVDDGGRALLWLEPWDGRGSLPFAALDPWFIEIARRARLIGTGDGRIRATARGTEVRRVAAEELSGVTGDPWTPLDRERGVAFSATGEGFGYRVLQRLLGDEYKPGVALRCGAGEGNSLLVASVLPRGQGKTGGYHERAVPVPARAVRLFDDEGLESLASRSRERVEGAADVEAWLRTALLALVQGDPEKLDWSDDRARAWLRSFESVVDSQFFEQLWASLDRPQHEALRDWERWLVSLARRLLHEAFDEAPVPEARRYRAIAAAEGVFEGTIRKKLPHLFEGAQGGAWAR